LGSIQGSLRTMYNASMPTQPTRSAISDTSIQMEWEARSYDHSATRRSEWPVQQRPFTHGMETRFKSSPDFGDRRTTIRELQRASGKRTFVWMWGLRRFFWIPSVAARNGSRALPSPRMSHGHRQVWERLMQGTLHAVTSKGIPNWETNGAGLRLAVLQHVNVSELKASHERLMQLCLWLQATSVSRFRFAILSKVLAKKLGPDIEGQAIIEHWQAETQRTFIRWASPR